MAEAGEEWVTVAECRTAGSFSDFLSAVNVWIKRPHVVNKRVLCSVVSPPVINDSTTRLERELIPKSSSYENVSDTVYIDEANGEVTFTPNSPRCEYLSYRLKYVQCSPQDARVFLCIKPVTVSNETTETLVAWIYPRKEWLQLVLLPKLCQWTDQPQTNGKGNTDIIPIGRYCTLYKELKEKYGPSLIQNWPESTDPLKFVYEDIAIATYLLVLWEEERNRCGLSEKQSFIDLGCGNGLLVYILSLEGHPGKGVDLRARRIWQLLRPVANLEVSSLTPSSITSYPEYDWLIGNHSDELTPWIPVMSARSSYDSKFFLLPCCSFDFDKKFCRPNSLQSQYRSYLDYVKEICVVMGFDVQEDTLRIPSSKRICLIGQSRNYSFDDEAIVEENRIAFIQSRCTPPHPTDRRPLIEPHSSQCDSQNVQSPEVWAEHFKPRLPVEVVRNCSQVDCSVQAEIVTIVTKTLLEKSSRWIQLSDNSWWNRGGQLALSEMAGSVGNDLLLKLKKECGGLTTLLRNHCQIFEVHRGVLELRDWSRCDLPVSARRKSRIWKKSETDLLHKTKLCWFNEHHPQGCPRQADLCPYAHGKAELRERPDFKSFKK